MSDEILDFAIVGGGVSGVYCGWRLLEADPNLSPRLQALAGGGRLKIRLFEASDRIGGRLLSVRPPGMPTTTCELGGMRYISSQDLTRSLVENVLDLKTEVLPASEANNLAYLRGVRLRNGELGDTAKVPYQLTGAEVGRDPGAMLLYALQQLVPGVDKMTPEEFDHVYATRKIDGRHLYDLGFWNLLLQVVSNEAYDFICDPSGYYSITTNWNAGDAIRMCLGDFATGITYRRLTGGFEEVPRELCRRFQTDGGEVAMRHRLVSFDTVDLPGGEGKGVALEVITDAGERTTVLARNLVLAMPRRSLQLLAQRGPLLEPGNREVQHLIDSVEGIPLFKIFVGYHSPWWEIAGVSTGESTTDLPIRQCYYWAVENQPGTHVDGRLVRNTNAMLMASYNDVRECYFWRGLEQMARIHGEAFESGDNPHVDADADHSAWNRYRAPKIMVDEVQRQLKLLHGVQAAPEPYCAAYKDWTEDPYGGGVHFWNIGYNSLECIPRMVKPMDDLPVYVVGEAYSKTQGWVQGALETSEIMLEQHFGLPAPSWVTPS